MPITKVVRLPAPSLADILFIVITLGTGGLSFARGHQIATHQWKQWNSENHTSTEEFIHILTFKGTLILSILQVCACFYNVIPGPKIRPVCRLIPLKFQ